jgi:hypothetical protein
MLKIPFAWAKMPLIDRFGDLDESLHVSFIYGADTWMDPNAGEAIKQYTFSSSIFWFYFYFYFNFFVV